MDLSWHNTLLICLLFLCFVQVSPSVILPNYNYQTMNFVDKVSYQLVALDLDGTTLNSHHQLSDKTISGLRILSAKGFRIAIATGRSAASIIDHINILQLSQNVPVVCLNGALGCTHTKENGTPVNHFSLTIPPEEADMVLNLAQKMNLVAQYYNGVTSEVYAVPSTDEHLSLLKGYASLTGKDQVVLPSYEAAKQRGEASKILLMTNDVDGLIQEAERSLPSGKFHIIRGSPKPFFVEFLPQGVNKGQGLRNLCEALNVPMSQVIAFGDGDNDREMLQYAGLGIAMKNAGAVAKAAADVVLEVRYSYQYTLNYFSQYKYFNCSGRMTRTG